jgi:hypothetical protein
LYSCQTDIVKDRVKGYQDGEVFNGMAFIQDFTKISQLMSVILISIVEARVRDADRYTCNSLIGYQRRNRVLFPQRYVETICILGHHLCK